MVKVFWPVVIIVLLTSLMAGACGLGQSEYNGWGIPSVREDLEILSHEAHLTSWGSFEVTGVAKNVGSARLKYLTIICRFYDSAGNKVDMAADYLSYLDPGQIWAFEVVSFDNRARSYDIGVASWW